MNGKAKSSVFLTGIVALAFSIESNIGQAQVRDIPRQAGPLLLKALRVEPQTVYGGNLGVQGTVELTQAPGPNGVTVTLESSNQQLAGVLRASPLPMG